MLLATVDSEWLARLATAHPRGVLLIAQIVELRDHANRSLWLRPQELLDLKNRVDLLEERLSQLEGTRKTEGDAAGND